MSYCPVGIESDAESEAAPPLPIVLLKSNEMSPMPPVLLSVGFWLLRYCTSPWCDMNGTETPNLVDHVGLTEKCGVIVRPEKFWPTLYFVKTSASR